MSFWCCFFGGFIGCKDVFSGDKIFIILINDDVLFFLFVVRFVLLGDGCGIFIWFIGFVWFKNNFLFLVLFFCGCFFGLLFSMGNFCVCVNVWFVLCFIRMLFFLLFILLLIVGCWIGFFMIGILLFYEIFVSWWEVVRFFDKVCFDDVSVLFVSNVG